MAVSTGQKTEEVDSMDMAACTEALQRMEDGTETWHELRMIKSTSPRVVCVMPSSCYDFVSSSLLAVGGFALLVEDEEDIEPMLMNSIGVILDVNGSKDLLNAFVEKFVPDTQPVIIVALGAGSNERKMKLAMELIDKCSPSAVCGRSIDLTALGEVVMAKYTGDKDDSPEEEPKSKGPILLKTRKLRKTRSPSPGRKARDLKKDMARKVTPIPALIMKGRFREGTFRDLDIGSIIKHGQRIAAEFNCTVLFHDLNLLTNGELVVDINTCQVGMQNIHAHIECMAALIAIVMGIVDEKGEECTIYTCAHGACLYYAAGEMAVEKATVNDSILPGSLRTHFIDTLHTLEEDQIRKRIKLNIYTQ